MEQTLFAIVTNEGNRDPESIAMQLMQELSAGTPWFDRAAVPEQ